jgi:hypothetical protein
MNAHIDSLNAALQPTRQRLLQHPIYEALQDLDGLRELTKYHVFAVWDFMSLLKSLQRDLTCVTVPWVPVGSGSTRYLINEIVTGEESDEMPEWLGDPESRISHYELYLIAMQHMGAETTLMDQFMAALKQTGNVETALSHADVPEGVRQFVNFSFRAIATNQPHIVASIFTFGREDLIPDMFLAFVQQMEESAPGGPLHTFRYYLERHIEVDGDHHSHLAMQMVSELCGDDETRWQEATDWAIQAIEARIGLWDACLERHKQLA